ncbi:MAG: DNA recombination protein RmuC [Phycisphaerae bacterium]|nr:DNA recombination protein RmuC [Phycisphaerae bacterium]
MSTIEIILCVIVLALVALVFVLISKLNKPGDDALKPMEILGGQLNESLRRQDERLAKINDQVGKSFNDFTSIINEQFTQQQTLGKQTQHDMGMKLDSAGKTIADLKGQLGQLSQATANIMQVGSEVRKLQDILQSPKLRGGLGEWSLEQLLSDVLPAQNYKTQYTFKDGNRVDAIVLLAQGKVCIDAKFPLPNFQLMIDAQEPESRQKARRAFVKDVKSRIDEISGKYILPEEGTLDFALMYLPAENVYYHTIIEDGNATNSLANYARAKKVIPVSPNTLYAYLMVIASGLNGLRIEQNARKVIGDLKKLVRQMDVICGDYDLVGKHLANAQGKYDQAGKKIDRFKTDLDRIADMSDEHSENTE